MSSCVSISASLVEASAATVTSAVSFGEPSVMSWRCWELPPEEGRPWTERQPADERRPTFSTETQHKGSRRPFECQRSTMWNYVYASSNRTTFQITRSIV